MAGPVVDSVTNGQQNTSTGLSVSFNNVAGDYLYVWVWDEWGGFAAINYVKYAGVALTKLLQKTLDGQRMYSLWGLASPATGSNTLEASRPSGIGFFAFCGLTLSGADPAGYEAINFNLAGTSSNTTTVSVTSVTANAIVVGGTGTAVGTVSTSAPATQRALVGTATALSTTPTTSAGSQSITWTQTGSWSWVSIAVAHAGSAPTTTAASQQHVDAGLVDSGVISKGLVQ